jgi:lysophospholipase L1-like esterase
MLRYALPLLLLLPLPVGAEPLALKDGDRVVLVGGTFIEREQRDGYWETALMRHFPGKAIVWRNLGWSGDTVRGESRGSFGGQPQGYKHLKEHVLALKPTVLILGYGAVESFDGEAGLAKFKADYARLLDELSSAKARVILLSPLPLEKLPGKPDPTEANKNLRLYADAIRDLAAQRKIEYVDLFAPILKLMESSTATPLTANGLHLTADGYRRTAPLIETAFGLDPNTGRTEFVEALRQAIVEKNTLYFYRWRPANETYLFGFRKHEQGQNAIEIPKFDPLVEKAEEQIRKLSEK